MSNIFDYVAILLYSNINYKRRYSMSGSKEDKLIGEKIRKFRVLKRISQEELGWFIGLSKQLVSRIEMGKRKISFTELSELAKNLNEPMEAFLPYDIKFTRETRPTVVYSDDPLPMFMSDFIDELEEYRKYLKKDERVWARINWFIIILEKYQVEFIDRSEESCKKLVEQYNKNFNKNK